jgi:anti-sigma regulatory factor (Ser/Thr protein kinase)
VVDHIEEELTRLNLCGPGGRVCIGVALHEAVTNAIFHGNLELNSELKERSVQAYYDLARSRRREEPYAGRRVHVGVRLTRQSATFTIRDEGPGFDPAALPDPTDPANLEKTAGRGLLLIRAFMDRVEHNPAGNQITLVKSWA